MARLLFDHNFIGNLTICRHLLSVRRKVINIFGPMTVDFDKLITGSE